MQNERCQDLFSNSLNFRLKTSEGQCVSNIWWLYEDNFKMRISSKQVLRISMNEGLQSMALQKDRRQSIFYFYCLISTVVSTLAFHHATKVWVIQELGIMWNGLWSINWTGGFSLNSPVFSHSKITYMPTSAWTHLKTSCELMFVVYVPHWLLIEIIIIILT